MTDDASDGLTSHRLVNKHAYRVADFVGRALDLVRKDASTHEDAINAGVALLMRELCRLAGMADDPEDVLDLIRNLLNGPGTRILVQRDARRWRKILRRQERDSGTEADD